MADEQESVEQVVKRLEKYGQAIAWKLLNSRDQGFDSHWKEEITQSLLLEGWKVWKDTGNEGLAKHRMRTRAANEFKKLLRTLKQPRPETGTRGQSQDGTWDWDGEDGPAETTEHPYRRVSVGPDVKSDVLDERAVNDLVEQMPEPRRTIVRCRMAGMTVDEMMEMTGLNRRAVERELAALKADLEEATNDE